MIKFTNSKFGLVLVLLMTTMAIISLERPMFEQEEMTDGQRMQHDDDVGNARMLELMGDPSLLDRRFILELNDLPSPEDYLKEKRQKEEEERQKAEEERQKAITPPAPAQPSAAPARPPSAAAQGAPANPPAAAPKQEGFAKLDELWAAFEARKVARATTPQPSNPARPSITAARRRTDALAAAQPPAPAQGRPPSGAPVAARRREAALAAAPAAALAVRPGRIGDWRAAQGSPGMALRRP